MELVIQISCGEYNCLALTVDKKVFAWGQGPHHNVPEDMEQVVAVFAGCSYSVALRSDGTIDTFGSTRRCEIPDELVVRASDDTVGYICK